MTVFILLKAVGILSTHCCWPQSTHRSWILQPVWRLLFHVTLHLAYQVWDLQRFSKGKFLLGIGSQIKPHIEKRFGVEFSPPAARMREYIQAVKAFFNCWQNDEPLDFRGKFLPTP